MDLFYIVVSIGLIVIGVTAICQAAYENWRVAKLIKHCVWFRYMGLEETADIRCNGLYKWR